MNRIVKGICLNCNNPLHNSDKFCPACGQKVAIHRLTFHSLTHDALHYFTHVEKNIFALIARLATQPGRPVKEYLGGKRKEYFSPVSFFLIVTGMLVLTSSLAHTFDIVFSSNLRPGNREDMFKHFITGKTNWVYLFITFLYPVFYRLFYFRQKLNYTEHLVVSLFWQGLLLLFFIVVLVPYNYFSTSLNSLYISFWIFIAAQCIYYAVGYTQLFGQRSFGAFFINLFLSILANLLIFAACILVLILYYIIVRHFFSGH